MLGQIPQILRMGRALLYRSRCSSGHYCTRSNRSRRNRGSGFQRDDPALWPDAPTPLYRKPARVVTEGAVGTMSYLARDAFKHDDLQSRQKRHKVRHGELRCQLLARYGKDGPLLTGIIDNDLARH